MSGSTKSAELSAGYSTESGTGSGGGGRRLLVGAGLLAVASLVLIGWYFAEISQADAVEAPAKAATPAEGRVAELQAPIVTAVGQFLGAPVTLRFDGKSFQTTWKELGLAADEQAVAREAQRLAGAGMTAASVGGDYYAAAPADRAIPVGLDRARGLDRLVAYKDQFDRAAEDVRIDLENRQVIPEVEGYGIDVYGSLAAIEAAARSGRKEIDLDGASILPSLTREKLGNLDIGTVMSTFETHYPPVEKDRNYNLKLVAERINGKIIMPGETISFNGVVGDRTEKEGYRLAHVISAGEMVDGMAGGACQISSTLHGAAWFAGLDIIDGRPHSRPSAYITMGMDATVVYPDVDLKLKNPYDFPVVIRYVVAQGTVKVEILGKPRPYDKIVFERLIKKVIPYETVTREDDSIPVGSTLIEQIGFPGYELTRRRLFYKDGKEIKEKTESRAIKYPATTEYLRIGTNPDPNLDPPKQSNQHGLPDPGGKTYRIER